MLNKSSSQNDDDAGAYFGEAGSCAGEEGQEEGALLRPLLHLI